MIIDSLYIYGKLSGCSYESLEWAIQLYVKSVPCVLGWGWWLSTFVANLVEYGMISCGL